MQFFVILHTNRHAPTQTHTRTLYIHTFLHTQTSTDCLNLIKQDPDTINHTVLNPQITCTINIKHHQVIDKINKRID